jgi:hypothetical protein
MARITCVFIGGNYRIHREGCADIKREPGDRVYITYPEGSTMLDIANEEFSDFIQEDPDYYTPSQVLADFEGCSRVLPCTKGHLAELCCTKAVGHDGECITPA